MLNRYLPCLIRKCPTTAWCCNRRHFHKLSWPALKTGNGVDRLSRGPVSRPQAWSSEQEAALRSIVQPSRTPGSRHAVREDNNNQPLLPKNRTANMGRGCPGTASKRGTHTSVATPCHCCCPHTIGHVTIQCLERGKWQWLLSPNHWSCHSPVSGEGKVAIAAVYKPLVM